LGPAEIKDFCWHGMKLPELEWVLFIVTAEKVWGVLGTTIANFTVSLCISIHYIYIYKMVQLMHLFVIKHKFICHTLKHLKSLQHVSIIRELFDPG
jgi:hypothetical protein